MSYVAELTVGDPRMSLTAQGGELCLAKKLTHAELGTLMRTIDAKTQALLDYEDITAHLEVQVAPGKVVKVSKYKAPQGFAPNQSLRVVTKSFASPEEEVTWYVDLIRKSDTSLDYAQALARVVQEHPGLWARHIESQRGGVRTPSLVAKQDAPSYDAILKTVRDRAVASGQSCQQAFAAVVQEHQGDADFDAYYRAYARYHVHEGLQDRNRELIAKLGGR